ncbi:LysR substrate-binding domain-containing protein [Halomonas sp. ML-15]|uniref:LysR substrate-binding domain-containing protein n=1 Tax=Halomonas sp. ML-15 TaxID=2773305 RepID=UPI001CD0F82D|nr:LysR substrate-binding domain-containing protein [Halomonas sp. ML-15]
MDSIGNSDQSRLPALDSDLLLAFVTVADGGGFTTAARYLHKTQSTISLRVRTLEDRLGTRLLNRTSRRLSLTADGQTFLVYARRLLQLQREALGALSVSSEPITLRFGLPEDYADTWLPALLERFSAVHPEVRVHIHCRMSTELLEQLDDGSLDLVLAVRHAANSGGEVVGKASVVWAAHRNFHYDPGSPLPLALFPEQCIYRRRALQALTEQGLAWQVDSTSQSPSGLRVIVDQARAVTLSERRMLPPHWRMLGEAEGLPSLPPAELEIHRSPSLTHPAFEAFVNRLREVIAEALPTQH